MGWAGRGSAGRRPGRPRGRNARLSMESIYRIEHGGHVLHAVRRDEAWHALEGGPWGTPSVGARLSGAEPRILAPIAPSKIVAVGLNYRDHAAEMNKALPDEPLIFLKPSTAVIGPGAPIVLPPGAGRVDYEAELGVVIGRAARRVPADRAHEYVLGFTCVNDVTDRGLQRRDVQYTPRQGVRHVRAGGSVHRRRGPGSAPRHRVAGQRRAAAALEHRRADLPTAAVDRVRHGGHDPAARRRPVHGDASGGRAPRAGRIGSSSRWKGSASW